MRVLFKKKYLFIFWTLCRVFIAVQGAVVTAKAFSWLQCVGSSIRWLLCLVSRLCRFQNALASVVEAHRLGCPAAVDSWLWTGIKPNPLHWQVDS